ncbi:putative dipeptidyl-peptidase 5 [Colletotrichum trifolii]|uniref:Chromatin modification-related protein EAF6 n=1 Tax=Colletotrichum trifolii TaxID=5466 RepID=A0A4R8RWI0_COLTR|nr:putative dipeptidyl-peptidase 5 [Colletotrichum trifolii]
MGENQNSGAGSQQAAPTMQMYKDEQLRLRQMLDKRAAISRRLANIESEIEQKETSYLESTPNGNIIAGFDNYIKGTGAAAQRRKAGATEQNRVFSRSSLSYRPGSEATTPGSTPASHAPTPVSTTFKDGSGSNHATPTSATASKSGKKNKKQNEEDSDHDSQAPNKKRINFGAGRNKSSQIRVLEVESGHSTLLYEDQSYNDATWLSDKEILLLKSGDKGSTSLILGDATEPSVIKEIRRFDGTLSSLKVKRLSENEVAVAVSALTTPSGALYNPTAEKKPYTSAKVYTSLFVRHWDTWGDSNHNSIWYGLLKKDGDSYKLEDPGLVNALNGTKLQSPVPPFGGAGDFDISKNGVVFVARDPEISPAIYTKSDLYFISLKSFTETKPPPPQIVKTSKLRGYSASPVFSRDGKKVAFTRMKSDQYETDKPRLLLVPDVFDLASVQEFYETEDGAGGWDARPEWITWSKDDTELYVSAEEHGRGKLWKLPATPRLAKDLPEPVYEEGSVIEAKLLGDDGNKLFISTSSRVENSAFSILDPFNKKTDLVSSSSKHGKSFGLTKSQCDEFWYKGAEGYDVHALVVKPSNFDENKKYPLAFLIHGGPQAAWMDSWSTRWNPAIFAEQGYVAVMPNPTGSTGYGQQHTDNIQNEWGGRPYVDLVKCFDHIEKNIPYIDSENAVALGASYGGYMINWIQGHELGRKFKALVCHDGVFSTLNQWSTEELFFPLHDFGGPLWENRQGYEKWDPAHHLDNWSTPQLVIHNELDYRLPISEGLAMFNVLQARGVPSRLVMFPDENHWVLKPENSLVWHREVLGWINKYIGLDKYEELAVRQK